MEKKISRQRVWQLKKIAEGNCRLCGKECRDGRKSCDDCARKLGTKKRQTPKSNWDSVDWTRKNTTIAKELGVSWYAVEYQRRKRFKKNN